MKTRVYVDENKVLELHNKGLTPLEIAKELNNHNTAIYRFFKRNNLEPNKKSRLVYTDEEEKEIIKLYLNNMTIREIHPYYPHLTEGQINHLLRRAKITRRNGKRIYMNEDYFENIDNKEKAYFLGLLYADGSCQINKKSQNSFTYSISIDLNTEDKEVIEKFAECIETNLKVRDYVYERDGRQRKTSKISIASKKMFDDLWKLGKRPMKVDTCLSIPDIDKSLISHFIRGYFDGDGTVYQTNDKYGSVKCGFYGTTEILTSIRDELARNGVNIGHLKITKQKEANVSLFGISRREDVIAFYNYIYEEANVFMKRRKNKFQELLSIR